MPKITELPDATLPLTGTELIPLVQNGNNVKTALSNLPSSASSGATISSIANARWVYANGEVVNATDFTTGSADWEARNFIFNAIADIDAQVAAGHFLIWEYQTDNETIAKENRWSWEEDPMRGGDSSRSMGWVAAEMVLEYLPAYFNWPSWMPAAVYPASQPYPAVFTIYKADDNQELAQVSDDAPIVEQLRIDTATDVICSSTHYNTSVHITRKNNFAGNFQMFRYATPGAAFTLPPGLYRFSRQYRGEVPDGIDSSQPTRVKYWVFGADGLSDPPPEPPDGVLDTAWQQSPPIMVQLGVDTRVHIQTENEEEGGTAGARLLVTKYWDEGGSLYPQISTGERRLAVSLDANNEEPRNVCITAQAVIYSADGEVARSNPITLHIQSTWVEPVVEA